MGIVKALLLAFLVSIPSVSFRTPPTYCTPATAAEAKKIAARNRALPRNRWIRKTDLPAKVNEASAEMAKALSSVQRVLSEDDVDNCSWAAMHIVMRNKVEPNEPYVADLKDLGNGYVLTLEKHFTPLLGDSSKAQVAHDDIRTKWKLTLMENRWSLRSTAGDHLSGSY